MTQRLMSNRDHLEALVFAVRNMASDADLQTTESLLRVIRTAQRASADLFPES